MLIKISGNQITNSSLAQMKPELQKNSMVSQLTPWDTNTKKTKYQMILSLNNNIIKEGNMMMSCYNKLPTTVHPLEKGSALQQVCGGRSSMTLSRIRQDCLSYKTTNSAKGHLVSWDTIMPLACLSNSHAHRLPLFEQH